MAKILFISDNFYPEVNAPATRTFEHCKEWVANGEDVTVITTVPNFPEGKIFGGYKNKIFQKEKIEGIKVIRVWSYVSANKGFLTRVIDYVSFAISAFIAGLFVRSDIIIGTSPQFFSVCATAMLSKIKRKPWVFELRDLWPASIAAVGAMKNKHALSFLEKVELWLYRDSDLVISLTNSFKKNLIERGINPSKIEVVPNGVDLDVFRPQSKDEKIVKKLDLKEKFVIGYVGTHGMAHALDFIVRSLSEVKNKNLMFLFVGSGAEKENVVNLAKKLKLDNVIFIDKVDKESVVRYLSVLDAALVNLKNSDVFKTVLPSKIFEATAMEKPIVLGVQGEAKELIDKYNAGVSFQPENKKDFLSVIEKISNNQDFYSDLKRGCSALSQDFNTKKLAEKMLKLIKNTL